MGNMLFLAGGIACIVYYLACGLFIRFGQSLLWIWPCLGAALIGRWALVRWEVLSGHGPLLPAGLRIALRVAVLACLALFLVVEGIILRAGTADPRPGLDTIVVLGAKVNGVQPSGALRNRIQRAAEYLSENPEARAVASGGKGSDEGISEAECIRRGLVARGIDEARILLEDRSTSTEENLRNCAPLIADSRTGVGLVTNNFHMYRTLRIARRAAGVPCYPIPVATSAISFPHYMVREFFAVMLDVARHGL